MNYYDVSRGWTNPPATPRLCTDEPAGDHIPLLDLETDQKYCGVCLEWLTKDQPAAQSVAATTSTNSAQSADGTASIVDTTGYGTPCAFWGGFEF